MGRAIFFLGEAYRTLRRNAAPSIAAIVTVAITLLLVGVLVPVLDASGTKTEDVREQIAVKIFLFKSSERGEIRALEEEIAGFPHVSEVEFVSSRQAIDTLQQRLNQKDILEALNNRNPLPPSFNIRLDDPNNLEAVLARLQPPGPSGAPQPISPAIEQVKTAEQTEEIRDVTNALKVLLLVIAVLLGGASLFLVGNTIRLSIYARRREVEVMRLVGATNWFIRWPFVIEGMVVGLVGAAIAVFILFVGKALIADPLSDNPLFENLNTIGFGWLLLVLVATATVVSALGSGVTLRRFLKT